MAFSPEEYGLVVAIGNQDGSITLCQYLEQKGDWQETKISAHDGAVSALSWAPATEPHLLKAESVDMTAEE